MAGNYEYFSQYCVCPTRAIPIPMRTTDGDEPDHYPVEVYNVNMVLIGTATNKSQYISIWNSDDNNRIIGVLSGGYGPFDFQLFPAPGVVPPFFVYGNPTAPATIPIEFGWFDDDYFTILHGVDNLVYQGSQLIVHNAGFSLNLPEEANGKYLVIRYPVGESLKTGYNNGTTPFMPGQIPDQVFREAFTRLTKQYLTTKEPFYFNSAQPINIF